MLLTEIMLFKQVWIVVEIVGALVYIELTEISQVIGVDRSIMLAMMIGREGVGMSGSF